MTWSRICSGESPTRSGLVAVYAVTGRGVICAAVVATAASPPMRTDRRLRNMRLLRGRERGSPGLIVTWERSHHKPCPSMYKRCYIDRVDLLDSSYWGPVHAVLGAIDADIAALYTDAGIEGVRTRFVGPLIDLHRFGTMTIRGLAERRQVSHSAMSQTAAA